MLVTVNRRPIKLDEPKQVQIIALGWIASVSYTGVARHQGGPWTSKRVQRWLTQTGGLPETFDEAVAILRERGATWLKTVRPRRTRAHGFCFAGFVKRSARVALISPCGRRRGECGLHLQLDGARPHRAGRSSHRTITAAEGHEELLMAARRHNPAASLSDLTPHGGTMTPIASAYVFSL